MKRMLLVLALASSPTLAEASKSVATQVGDPLRPADEAHGKTVVKLVSKFFAGSKGPMSEAARANLKTLNQRERKTNRVVRRTMKECIKLGNVLGDDVKGGH